MKKIIIGVLIVLGVGALAVTGIVLFKSETGYSSQTGKPTDAKVSKTAEPIKTDYEDNDYSYTPQSTKQAEPEIKCSFCGTKKSIYSETYNEKEIHLCNQSICSEQYSDYRNHNNDIINYQKLIDAIALIPDQDFFENIKNNVYEIKYTNSNFIVTENDKELSPFLKNNFYDWLTYQLGVNFRYKYETKLNATTYQIKVDFPNDEITRVKEPVQSEYQPK